MIFFSVGKSFRFTRKGGSFNQFWTWWQNKSHWSYQEANTDDLFAAHYFTELSQLVNIKKKT
jgi:hypothetical protein